MPATTDAPFDTDVTVIGAGPIGLAAACALRQHGVPCRILEERAEPKAYSRANNFWARPQELLASIGVRDALAETSYRIKEVNTILNSRPVNPLAVDAVASPYGKVLQSGQDVIETTLSDLAAGRGRTVPGFDQNHEGVTVEVRRGGEDAPTERLRCRYLLGADGTKGTVRTAGAACSSPATASQTSLPTGGQGMNAGFHDAVGLA